jgi:hypothetical protein
MTNKDEQYYRVDFESAKLLKDAGFDAPTHSFYNPTYIETNNCLLYPFQGGNIDNWNKESHLLSAPLIDIALVWCYEKDYFMQISTDYVVIWADFKTMRNRVKQIKTDESLGTMRDINLLFIQACCEHQIKLKNQ